MTAPVRVLLRLPSILEAGLGRVLAPHVDRVVVVRDHLHRPQVVVFDPAHVGLADPLESAHGLALVALSGDPSPWVSVRARLLGAQRLLGLEASASEIVTTLVEAAGPGAGAADLLPALVGTRDGGILSDREADVVALICEGLSNEEIAARLFLGVNTIKTHIRTAYRKMGVTSRSQAVLWGMGQFPDRDDGGLGAAIRRDRDVTAAVTGFQHGR